jgi:hypothetical protein
MTINELANKIHTILALGLDHLDILLINEILLLQKQEGDVTIMRILKEFEDCASQANTHARIKKLVDKKILAKKDNPDNLKQKFLVKGEAFDALRGEI